MNTHFVYDRNKDRHTIVHSITGLFGESDDSLS